MITFTVHEEPSPRADRIDRAERLVFVKDGFSIVAAYLGPVWLAANRLWLPLIGYVAVIAGSYVLFAALGVSMNWLSTLAMAVHAVIGFEHDSLKRSGMERRGWHSVGTVTGRNAAECERRFFDAWLPAQPMIAPGGREIARNLPHAPALPPVAAAATSAPVVAKSRWGGLFGARRRAGRPASGS